MLGIFGVAFLALGIWVIQAPKTEAAPINFDSPSKFKDLTELVDSIVKFLFFVGFPLAVLLLVIAAFLFMTAEGEPQKIAKAKTLIFYTLLAFIIIILAKAIASLFTSALG